MKPHGKPALPPRGKPSTRQNHVGRGGCRLRAHRRMELHLLDLENVLHSAPTGSPIMINIHIKRVVQLLHMDGAPKTPIVTCHGIPRTGCHFPHPQQTRPPMASTTGDTPDFAVQVKDGAIKSVTLNNPGPDRVLHIPISRTAGDTPRRLKVSDGRIYWECQDGSHRAVTLEDAEKINSVMSQAPTGDTLNAGLIAAVEALVDSPKAMKSPHRVPMVSAKAVIALIRQHTQPAVAVEQGVGGIPFMPGDTHCSDCPCRHGLHLRPTTQVTGGDEVKRDHLADVQIPRCLEIINRRWPPDEYEDDDELADIWDALNEAGKRLCALASIQQGGSHE